MSSLHSDFVQFISNLDHPHQDHYAFQYSSELVEWRVVIVECFISYPGANCKTQSNCESQHLQEIKETIEPTLNLMEDN